MKISRCPGAVPCVCVFAWLVRCRRNVESTGRLEDGGVYVFGTDENPGMRFWLDMQPSLNLQFYVQTLICTTGVYVVLESVGNLG